MSALSIMVKPVSGACNMHCAYCFYSDVMSRRKTHVYPHMSEQTLEILVQRVFRYADNQVSFFFQGGEPTLAGLPFFEALIRFEQIYNVRNLPVFNAVQTNAYALSDEMISFFARENFLLGVSLDGDRFAHDHLRLDQSGLPTFDRVCANLNRLTHAGVEFNILCVVNKYVAQRARDVFENLAPYRYLQFIACLDDFDGHKTNYSLTEQSYLHFLKTCFDLYFEAFQAGRPVSIRCFDNYLSILLGLPPESCAMFGECGQYLLIEADGSVYPCDFYVLDKWNLGNISEVSFNRLVNSEKKRRFIEESRFVPEACKHCRWYPLCRNGCKRERNPQTGLNRWCACFQEFFTYAYFRLEAMARAIREKC